MEWPWTLCAAAMRVTVDAQRQLPPVRHLFAEVLARHPGLSSSLAAVPVPAASGGNLQSRLIASTEFGGDRGLIRDGIVCPSIDRRTKRLDSDRQVA